MPSPATAELDPAASRFMAPWMAPGMEFTLRSVFLPSSVTLWPIPHACSRWYFQLARYELYTSLP